MRRFSRILDAMASRGGYRIDRRFDGFAVTVEAIESSATATEVLH
jgi:hypothetical protein